MIPYNKINEQELIGKTYGDMTLIEFIGRQAGDLTFNARCNVCGTIKKVWYKNLKAGKGAKHGRCNRVGRKADVSLEIGKVYGDLTITSFKEYKSNNLLYTARCNICGRERDVWIKDIKKGTGNSHKNCTRLLPKDAHTKRLRNIWSKMVDRCDNPNDFRYHHYGGRGIKHNYPLFIDFYDDLIDSYLKHIEEFGVKETTLDRIDVNGDYTKDNLRWATWSEQAKNKRKTIVKATNGLVEISGGVDVVAKQIPCDISCIYDCIKGKLKKIKGFTIIVIEQPLTTRAKRS